MNIFAVGKQVAVRHRKTKSGRQWAYQVKNSLYINELIKYKHICTLNKYSKTSRKRCRNLKKNSIIFPLKIAATYIGTVIGAGFATGKEIVTFFSLYGYWGTIGIVIATFLFAYIGSKMMLLAYSEKLYTPLEFNNFLFGKKVGAVVTFIILLLLVCVTGVMLSGAGAVVNEQLGLPAIIGTSSLLIITIIIVKKGVEGILSINSFIVPIMILFSVTISIFAIIRQDSFSFFPEVISTVTIDKIINPFSYVAFNLVLSQGVLLPVAREATSKKQIIQGGVIGGIGLGLLLLCSHLSISTIDHFYTYQIPMAEVVKTVASVMHLFFVTVVICEIITTLVGNVFGLVEQTYSYILQSRNFAIFTILAITFCISRVNYHELLTLLYPLFGYISFIFIPFLIFKRTTSST